MNFIMNFQNLTFTSFTLKTPSNQPIVFKIKTNETYKSQVISKQLQITRNEHLTGIVEKDCPISAL